jgi:hypothetical protein
VINQVSTEAWVEVSNMARKVNHDVRGGIQAQQPDKAPPFRVEGLTNDISPIP